MKIVITGVTRGIGGGLVEELIERNHQVFGCGRSQPAIDALQRQHPQHDFAAVDVTDAGQVSAWAERVVKASGAPDFVINNAALINEVAPLWTVSEKEFSDIVDVNIKGVHHVTRSFLPSMIARGSGVVVNFSSGWGKSTSPGVAPYCATKWAVEGLTQALSQDLPAGLAAIALSPGTVHTEMLTIAFGAEGASQSVEPRAWARRVAPQIVAFGPSDNGRSLELRG